MTVHIWKLETSLVLVVWVFFFLVLSVLTDVLLEVQEIIQKTERVTL